MKHIALAAFAAALLLGGGTASAQEIVVCKMPNANANSKAFYSANTNSGKGNGGELIIEIEVVGNFSGNTLFSSTTCLTGLPVDDGDIQLGNAANPVSVSFPDLFTTTTTTFVSDPGNSPN